MAGILTHLRHELAHAIWCLLLDDDLMHAYTDGEAIKLFDQIMQAMLPQPLLLHLCMNTQVFPKSLYKSTLGIPHHPKKRTLLWC